MHGENEEAVEGLTMENNPPNEGKVQIRPWRLGSPLPTLFVLLFSMFSIYPATA
jgi:hypothetical protein